MQGQHCLYVVLVIFSNRTPSSTFDFEYPVQLNKSQLFGDVSVFSQCRELKVLLLSLTHVKGPLSAFAECQELIRLNLRGAGGISGKANDLLKTLPGCTVVM